MSAGETRAIRSRDTPDRCPDCGRAEVTNSGCGACGFEFTVAAPPMPSLPVSATTTFTNLPTVRPSVHLSAPTMAASRDDTPGTIRRSSISGRVVLVMPATSEPMDADPWKWFAVPLWGVILLASPVIVGLMALQTSGWLVAAVVFLVLTAVLRFLFSSQLFWSWQTVAALRGRHVVEPMPVTMLRLRIEDEGEVQLRMKGHTEGGAVAAGDRVAASGTWCNGILRVDELHCRRTGAVLRPRQPRALPWLIAGLAVVVMMLAWIQFSFMPWMNESNLPMR